jgi:hypothetical protein
MHELAPATSKRVLLLMAASIMSACGGKAQDYPVSVQALTGNWLSKDHGATWTLTLAPSAKSPNAVEGNADLFSPGPHDLPFRVSGDLVQLSWWYESNANIAGLNLPDGTPFVPNPSFSIRLRDPNHLTLATEWQPPVFLEFDRE